MLHINPSQNVTSMPSSDSAEPESFAGLLRSVCNDLVNGFDVPAGALLLYDDIADACSVVATEGDGWRGLHGATLPLAADSAVSRALEDDMPVVVSEFPAFEGLADESVLPGDVLVLPLWYAEPVGVFLAPNPESPEANRSSALQPARRAARRIAEAHGGGDSACVFRRFLDLAPGGFAVVEGADYTVRYASRTFRQVLGLDSVPLLGRSLSHIARQGGTQQSLVEKIRHTDVARQFLAEVVLDQFGSRYYDVHLLPDIRSGYEPALYVVLWPRTDAVQTRRALETSVMQLAEAQDTLAAVLDSTVNGILYADREGTILYANRRVGELLGLDPSDVIGRYRHDVLRELVAPRTRGAGATARTIDDAVTEIEMVEPSRRILERYCGPVQADDGTVLGSIDVYSDVTEIRNLQQSKDQFLSVVSHELRTPVTSIKGYAQLLRRRAESERVSARTQAAYDIIERQTSRMQGLIDVLLDLSRIEVGRLPLDLAPVDVRGVILETMEMLRMTSDRHDFEVVVPEEPVLIEADVLRLEQVVTNLVGNAVRYSPNGGEIRVSLEASGEHVTIEVQDRGLGIPPDATERIFERFVRVGARPESTGLGIGLFLTKSIVEQHGGSVSVRSLLGKGSTFTVRLPALSS